MIKAVKELTGDIQYKHIKYKNRKYKNRTSLRPRDKAETAC